MLTTGCTADENKLEWVSLGCNKVHNNFHENQLLPSKINRTIHDTLTVSLASLPTE
jgi:hypothetical protein